MREESISLYSDGYTPFKETSGNTPRVHSTARWGINPHAAESPSYFIHSNDNSKSSESVCSVEALPPRGERKDDLIQSLLSSLQNEATQENIRDCSSTNTAEREDELPIWFDEERYIR